MRAMNTAFSGGAIVLLALVGCDASVVRSFDPATASVEPELLDFGEHPVGSITERSLTVTNIGDERLFIEGIRVDGTSVFSIVSPPKRELPGLSADNPDASKSRVRLMFVPSETGTFAGQLVIDVGGTDPNTVVVQLIGIGARDCRDGACGVADGGVQDSDVAAIDAGVADTGVGLDAGIGDASEEDLQNCDPTAPIAAPWDSRLGWIGVTGIVGASVAHDCSVYFGGIFFFAGGLPVSSIVRWNRATRSWSALGSGIESGWNVFALAADDEHLYAGGNFAAAGGTAASGVARFSFSTQTWESLGAGIDPDPGGQAVNAVYAIEVIGDEVYVGGHFDSAGGVASKGIARWSKQTGVWSDVGGGISGTDARVNDIVKLGDELYVGGIMSRAGGVDAKHIARWSLVSETWSALGEGTNYSVESLDVDSGRLFVAGNFTMAGPLPANHIAEWVAQSGTWRTLGTGTEGRAQVVAALGGSVYVSGHEITRAGGVEVEQIARFDLTTLQWNAVGGVSGGPILTFAEAGGELYAAGAFQSAAEVQVQGVARFDGSEWFGLGGGVSGADTAAVEVRAVAVDSQAGYVAGRFETAGGVPSNNVARWEIGPNRWTDLSGGLDGTVNALAIRAGTLYAAGQLAAVNNIAQHDAAGWRGLGSGINGQVYALAVAGDLYAGGAFSQAGGVAAQNIARWNGSTWSPVGPGLDGAVRALAADGQEIIAGGEIESHVRRFSANAWLSIGEGLDDVVTALAVDGNTIYAGMQTMGVAKWDGSGWTTLAGGDAPGSPITSITLSAGRVFAGSGGTQNRLVEWTPSGWQVVAGDVDGPVLTLGAVPDGLILGGTFTQAGATPSWRIAHWIR